MRAYRPCRQIGCNELTRDAHGYCPAHVHTPQEQHTEYKRCRTDKAEQAFYAGKSWAKVRAMAMSRDHGLCQRCLIDDKVTVADVVHHIVYIKDDQSKMLVLSNIVCLCNSCHQKAHKGRG